MSRSIISCPRTQAVRRTNENVNWPTPRLTRRGLNLESMLTRWSMALLDNRSKLIWSKASWLVDIPIRLLVLPMHLCIGTILRLRVLLLIEGGRSVTLPLRGVNGPSETMSLRSFLT